MTSPVPTQVAVDFPKMMRAWVSGECAHFPEESMRQFKCWWDRILNGVRGSSKHAASDREDEADEVIGFLVELRRAGNDSIESLAGFKTAFFRHLRRHKPNAKSELWGVTNEALKQLENDKRIRLVSRFDQKSSRSHNEDEWACNPPEAAKTPYTHFSTADFKTLEYIWFEKVAQPRKGAVHHSVRLLSPTEAQNFLSAVLEHFNRVMTMEQLHEALVRNNPIFSTETVLINDSEDGEPSDSDPISCAPATGLSERTLEFIQRESDRRGKGLGTQLLEENFCPLFNGYYMRKEFRGERVILAGVGGETAQRNSEGVKKILRMIRSHLPFYKSPDEFVPDEIADEDLANMRSQFIDKMDTIRKEVFTRTLEVAEEFCSENCRA